jgi:hypothetical protein
VKQVAAPPESHSIDRPLVSVDVEQQDAPRATPALPRSRRSREAYSSFGSRVAVGAQSPCHHPAACRARRGSTDQPAHAMAAAAKSSASGRRRQAGLLTKALAGRPVRNDGAPGIGGAARASAGAFPAITRRLAR